MKTLRRFSTIAALVVAFLLGSATNPVRYEIVPTADAQSTTLSFSVPTAIIPELTAEMEYRYGRQSGETNANLARRSTREYFWRPLVDERRRRLASQSATLTAPGDLGT